MARFLAIAALLVAVAVPPAVSAEGGDKSGIAGIVHIRNKPPYFHGNIGAENGVCAAPRTIKLYKRKRSGDRKLLGTTVSEFFEHGDVKASWEIPIDAKPGSYFAASPRQTMDNGGFPEDCARAKSRTITLD